MCHMNIFFRLPFLSHFFNFAMGQRTVKRSSASTQRATSNLMSPDSSKEYSSCIKLRLVNPQLSSNRKMKNGPKSHSRIVKPLVAFPSSLFNMEHHRGSRLETVSSESSNGIDTKSYRRSVSSGTIQESLHVVEHPFSVYKVGSIVEKESLDRKKDSRPSTSFVTESELHFSGEGVCCGMRVGFLLFEYPGSGLSAPPPSMPAIIEAALKVSPP